jgi:uncharacterized membrane protein
MHAAQRVSGGVLWANLHLLFWLSLLPFATGWMSENRFARVPCAVYGCVLLMAAVAYALLQQRIIAMDEPASPLARALGADWKGKLSPAIYLLAIGLSFIAAWPALALYVLVAGMWLVPDRRIEKSISEAPADPPIGAPTHPANWSP